MPGEWRMATVATLQREGSLLVEDGNHGEYRPRPDEFCDSGVAFIRAADMDAGRVLFETASKINDVARHRITKGIGAAGDVLLSHKGTVGKVALVPDDAPPFVCSPQTTFWRSLDPQRLDRRYLYAFLRSPEFHVQLATRAHETDMAPYVSLTSQRELAVSLPPIATQHAIARILGALDDKIELNRRMNETLEAMARAVFKSWFVDFDPVRAKAAGRPPAGMDAATDALFPDGFEDSPRGPIPAGWTLESLRTAATSPRRSVTPVGLPPGTPYIGLEHMPRANITLGEWGDAASVVSGKSRFYQWEILFGKLRPYFHKVGVAPIDGVCSTDIVVVTPKSSEWFSFVLGHVSSAEFVSYTDVMSTGTKMPRTNWDDMANYEIVLPTPQVAQAFDCIVRPMIATMHQNVHQSRTLAAIRDALLPKLLSGTMRVTGAEHVVQDTS